jgi:hypothetical protein
MNYPDESRRPDGPACSVVKTITGLALVTLLASLTACTTIEVPEPDINHPANPAAMSAPLTSLPDTLNVEAVTAPEMPADPHAGHNMGSHSGHNMEPKKDEAADPHAGHRM